MYICEPVVMLQLAGSSVKSSAICLNACIGTYYAFVPPGVALLPFVDEKRLHAALESVYPDLTDDEISRNVRGSDRLFVGPHHPSHDLLGENTF